MLDEALGGAAEPGAEDEGARALDPGFEMDEVLGGLPKLGIDGILVALRDRELVVDVDE